MKTHLPSRLRSALLTALASVSIPTLTAASLVTFSSQAAAEYNPESFQKAWTTEPAESYNVPDQAIVTINKENVNVTSIAGNRSDREVRFISNSTTNKDYYALVTGSVENSRYRPSFKGAYGNGLSQTIVGNMYVKHSAGGYVNRIDAAENVTLKGSTYLEIAGTATYGVIYGAYDANIVDGSSTIVVKGGDITSVYACISNQGKKAGSISGGSFIEIDGGKFSSVVSAGADDGDGSIIENGTHLLINGGEFSANVCAGSTMDKSEVHGGTYTCITGGKFTGRVTGGATAAKSVIEGGIDLTITGGTYEISNSYVSGIYAAFRGQVKDGQVSLTIRGDKASFADNYVISSGSEYNWDVTFGADVTSKVTLADLTEASSLIKSTSAPQGIQVKGLVQKDTVLEMSNVKGTLNAKLSNFSSMEVKDGSKVTLTQALNETLGGATTVNIAEDSTLALESAEGQTWTLSTTTLDGAGTLGKTGKGTLAVSGTTSAFTGSMNIAEGTLEVRNAMETASLSGSGKLAKTGAGTMSVENASGFTGDIEATGGKLELEQVDLTVAKAPQKVSVSNNATVNLIGMEGGNDLTMTELSIDAGTLGVYINGEKVAGDNDANVGKLTLATGGTLVIGASTEANVNVLEANLVTKAGSTLDFSSGGQLTMGCDVNAEAGTKFLISEDAYTRLQGGEDITLFTGVDNKFSMDVTDYVFYDLATASEGSGESKTKVYFQTVDGNAVLSTTAVPTPEPTTSTLSLLALAGLCARRRRKH